MRESYMYFRVTQVQRSVVKLDGLIEMFPIGINGFSVDTDELLIDKMRGKAKINTFQNIIVFRIRKSSFLLRIPNFAALILEIHNFFRHLN